MEFEEIKNELEKSLKPKRFMHTLNVVKEVVRLSRIYGENEEKAKLAALLHDCAKYLKNEELLTLATSNGVEIDNVQKFCPELLHGPVGAILAKQKYKVTDDDILNSITFHTTGRANMSLLEKIIYLGDLIEESRDFPGIKKIRDEASNDLNKSLLLACNSTISFIIKNDTLLHPLSIELRNNLLAQANKK